MPVDDKPVELVVNVQEDSEGESEEENLLQDDEVDTMYMGGKKAKKKKKKADSEVDKSKDTEKKSRSKSKEKEAKKKKQKRRRRRF